MSSKSHWDVPIDVNGKVIHLLASHPTPPVFDGDEERNGTKNHDEVRFWLDYVTPNNSDYIYEDNLIDSKGVFRTINIGYAYGYDAWFCCDKQALIKMKCAIIYY